MAIKVSTDEVRRISGAPVGLISNEDIKALVKSTSTKTEEHYGVKFTPTKKIEILEGEWKNKILLDEYFPLKVLKLRNGNTDMDLTNIFAHTDEGMLQIYGDSIQSQYTSRFSGFNIDVKVKYLYGALERDTTAQSESTDSVLAGANIVVPVENSSFFSEGDYVFIEDMNRAYELAKVVLIPDATSITLDLLNNPYETEALVTNTKTMEIFNQYVLYETAIAVAINAIGSTYTVNTSYNLGPLGATKGVPYTHWRESTEKNIKQRDELKQRMKSLLGAFV